jgi:hypothetical protein
VSNSNFKEGTLACRWRKNLGGCGPDLVFYFPRKPDGHLLHSFFNYPAKGEKRCLVAELEARGYDITTLQFTIRMKEKPDE